MREASWFDIFLLKLGFRQRFAVEGNSMLPALKDGDEVLVKRVSNLHIGDIVVAHHPYKITPIIKRITNISADGKLFLKGDNPDESTDSRTFGEIAEKDMLGKVVGRFN